MSHRFPTNLQYSVTRRQALIMAFPFSPTGHHRVNSPHSSITILSLAAAKEDSSAMGSSGTLLLSLQGAHANS